MDNIRRFEAIADYNAFNNNETLHPLVSVVDLSKAAPRQGSRMYFGFYTIFLKEVKCGDLVYGRHTYDYQEGTLVFLGKERNRQDGTGVYTIESNRCGKRKNI